MLPVPMQVDYVDPFIGTDSTRDFSGGNTLPLVVAPFGMTAWTPQTDTSNWLFQYRQRKIGGFRATHQPSPWMGDYGYFTLMPQTGPRELDFDRRSSVYRHDETTMRPYLLKTRLGRYETEVALTATERCAFFQFRFPAADEVRLVLDLTKDGTAAYDARHRRLAIRLHNHSGGVPDNFAFHAVLQLDVRATFVRAGDQAVLEFPRRTRAVEVRVGTSFISSEQAAFHVAAELGQRSFGQVAAAARLRWNRLLGRVTIDGASPAQQRTFYTALYRTLLFPRQFHEPCPDGRVRHYSPYDGRVHDGVLSADNGFWDTFRTVYPLLAWIYPDLLGDILTGWIHAFDESGWFPAWSSPGHRGCMIGTHSDAVFASACVRGVPGVDWGHAYEGLRRNAFEAPPPGSAFGRTGLVDYLRLGYLPADRVDHSCAATQEYAFSDYCVAQVARHVGRMDDYRELMHRAGNYRNVFDRRTGFMRGRRANGSWVTPFDPFAWSREYIEGSAWQYTWAVPHDPEGLIALMGGSRRFVRRLDDMLAQPPVFRAGRYGMEIHEMTEMASAAFGQYAHSNQPVHHVLYLYACAGRPDRTRHWTHRVMNELYSDRPDGLSGDEDNGEMSAWYVWNALGLFPLNPADPGYVVGAPLFPRATVKVPGRSPLEVITGSRRPARAGCAVVSAECSRLEHRVLTDEAIKVLWHRTGRGTPPPAVT